MPPPPAARFQQHGKADFARGGQERALVGHDVAAGVHGESRLGKCGTGAGLFAEGLDPVGLWPDEMDAGRCHGGGEAGVFRQEAVAGMQRVGAGCFGGGDHRFDVEIGIGGAIAGQTRHGGGLREVRRLRVDVRIRSDAVDAELPARPHNAAGNHAAIGDEDAAKHGAWF